MDEKIDKRLVFVFGFEGILSIFLDSSMVEHSAVNRVVVGSSPTRGVSKFGIFFSFLHILI